VAWADITNVSWTFDDSVSSKGARRFNTNLRAFKSRFSFFYIHVPEMIAAQNLDHFAAILRLWTSHIELMAGTHSLDACSFIILAL
jgi:hypothetical protein